PLGSRASVREPTDEGKSHHHGHEDFEKGIHSRFFDRVGPTSHIQMDLGSPGRQRASFIMLPGMSAVGNCRSRTISERTFTYRVAKARSCERKPILETPPGNSGRSICVLLPDFGIFSYSQAHGTPSPRS